MARLRAGAENEERAEEKTSWDVATKLSYAPVFIETSRVKKGLSRNAKKHRKRTGKPGYNRQWVSRRGRDGVGGRVKLG